MDWIQKMREGMKLIGEACAENMEWNDCDRCPFDELCTSINDGYLKGNWHDMADTMKIVLKEKGYEN